MDAGAYPSCIWVRAEYTPELDISSSGISRIRYVATAVLWHGSLLPEQLQSFVCTGALKKNPPVHIPAPYRVSYSLFWFRCY